MKSFIISILMLFAFTGYSQEYSYSRELKKMTLEEKLTHFRELKKWENGGCAMPLDRPLTGALYADPVIEEPDEAHYPNVFIWILVGLGTGLILGSLNKESNK